MEQIETTEDTLTIEDFRTKILEVEQRMFDADGTVTGDALNELCPLKHSYGDGCYVREIFMPKGTLIVSKIHKKEHPFFVLKGKADVLTEDGVQTIEAPYQGMTPVGTKRALYIHEDMVWITVHVTDKTDLEEIEEQIIAKDFSELLELKEVL